MSAQSPTSRKQREKWGTRLWSAGKVAGRFAMGKSEVKSYPPAFPPLSWAQYVRMIAPNNMRSRDRAFATRNKEYADRHGE